MRVGIIGRTGALLESANAILASGHQIAFVLTCKSEPYYDKKESDFQLFAEKLKVPFFNTLDLNSHKEIIQAQGADVGISINWLTILKDSFLSNFPFGVLNAHAGDLPRYKGNACPNWALLNFEKRIGLTIHKMVEELDSGPYLLKRYLEISETTYITEVYDWLNSSVPEMFVEALALIHKTGFIEQDKSTRALRAYPRKPEDSRINWCDTTREILANIRASSHPFSGAYCFLNNSDTRIVIYRASSYEVDFDFLAVPGQVCMAAKGRPVIATSDGLIVIEECFVDELNANDSLFLITKSLRNRLT